MKKVLLSFLLLLLSSSFLYADSFFVEKHLSENKYYDTLGYGIGELLESKKCPNCVEYDINNVYGESSEYLLQNVDIYGISTFDNRYGLIRTPYVYDRVSLPPYSALDFLYWSVNLANDDVNIHSLSVFLTKSIISYSDLRYLLYINGEYKEVPLTYLIWNYPRKGVAKDYPGFGIVRNGEGFVNGTILDRVYVKSPLEFVKWEASVDGEFAFLNMYIRNNSNWELKNIVFNHYEYTNSRTFQPNEEYMYEYVVDISYLENSLGYAGLYNPNSQTQCSVLGENIESEVVADSAPMTGVREENGEYLNYVGSRVKPFKESFCITQIPYTLYSEEMKLTQEEQEGEEILAEEDIDFEGLGKALGIAKLPQTGSKKNSLLVVMSRLWYYLTRRI